MNQLTSPSNPSTTTFNTAKLQTSMPSLTFLPQPPLISPKKHSSSRPYRHPSIACNPPPRTALHTVDRLRQRAASLKCPFWRRRFGDMLDTARQILVWALVARHKSLPLPLPQPSLYHAHAPKTLNLPVQERLRLIERDFRQRQYYITGRLTATIYANDCTFDGPDPDVPVTGLSKYVSATAGLFDRNLSRVDLLAIWAEGECEIRATWRLEGALNLPWKPRIKPYTGETVYTFDERGLVVRHDESWSVSALDAFVSVIWPGFGAPPAPPVQALLQEGRAGKNGLESTWNAILTERITRYLAELVAWSRQSC